MRVEMNIHGVDGLLKTLERLPKEVVSKRGGPVRFALARGARFIRDKAKENVMQGVAARGNESTGVLAKNIVASRASRGIPGQKGELFKVRVRPRVRHYAGNRRNVRTGRAGKAYLVEGPAYYGRFLEYGTSKMRAHPWLRPAVKQHGHTAISMITQDLRKRLDIEVRKLALRNSDAATRL